MENTDKQPEGQSDTIEQCQMQSGEGTNTECNVNAARKVTESADLPTSGMDLWYCSEEEDDQLPDLPVPEYSALEIIQARMQEQRAYNTTLNHWRRGGGRTAATPIPTAKRPRGRPSNTVSGRSSGTQAKRGRGRPRTRPRGAVFAAQPEVTPPSNDEQPAVVPEIAQAPTQGQQVAPQPNIVVRQPGEQVPCDRRDEDLVARQVSPIYHAFVGPLRSTPTHDWYRCVVCSAAGTNTEIKQKSDTGGSGNLRYHLERYHVTRFEQLTGLPSKYRGFPCNGQQGPAPTPGGNIMQLMRGMGTTEADAIKRHDFYSHKNMTGHRSLLALMIKDKLPFDLSSRIGIGIMAALAFRGYRVPSAWFFKNQALPALAKIVERRAQCELHNKHFYSLTTDTWKSRSGHSFQSLVVRFVDTEWRLQQRKLDYSAITGEHTAPVLQAHINALVAKWSINQLCGLPLPIVADAGRNIVAAIREKAGWEALHCNSHQTHLSVLASVAASSTAQRIVDKVCRLSGHFNHSAKHKSEFSRYLKRCTTQRAEGFITPVATRWNSMAHALERYTKLHNNLHEWSNLAESERLGLDTVRENTLNDMEVEYARQIGKILTLIEKSQLRLQADGKPTGIVRVRELNLLHSQLTQYIEDAVSAYDVGKAIAEAYLRDLEDRCSPAKMELWCLLAFLAKPANGYYTPKWFSDEERAFIQSRVVQWLRDWEGALKEAAVLMGFQAPANQQQLQPPTIQRPATTTEHVPNSQEEWKLDATIVQQQGQDRTLMEEIAAYNEDNPQSDPYCFLEGKFSLLAYWKSRATKFPRLAVAARWALTVPATSVSSEAMFSVTGGFVTPTRTCLSPETLRKLTFCCFNSEQVDFEAINKDGLQEQARIYRRSSAVFTARKERIQEAGGIVAREQLSQQVQQRWGQIGQASYGASNASASTAARIPAPEICQEQSEMNAATELLLLDNEEQIAEPPEVQRDEFDLSEYAPEEPDATTVNDFLMQVPIVNTNLRLQGALQGIDEQLRPVNLAGPSRKAALDMERDAALAAGLQAQADRVLFVRQTRLGARDGF